MLQKLREFQDLGHTVVLIVGDYTARVGDPSGRSATRPVLSGEQIDANARTYVEQAGKILRTDERLEIRHNSEWLDMRMEDAVPARPRRRPSPSCSSATTSPSASPPHQPISLLELLYPVLQGYDSVAIDADIELGGTDQTFNLLMGRAIQTRLRPAAAGRADDAAAAGHRRRRRRCRSRSATTIGITEPPDEMYGKTLSIPDAAMPSWYDLLLGAAPPEGVSPRDAKHALARALVERFHGRGGGRRGRGGLRARVRRPRAAGGHRDPPAPRAPPSTSRR